MISIIFSRNRPLQLQALLESMKFACGDLDIYVIYDSDDPYLYDQIKRDYWEVNFIDQKIHGGFEIALRNIIESETNQYTHILFLCDDSIFTGFVNLYEISTYLRKNRDTLEFSLRLGTNIQPQPYFLDKGTILEWVWEQSQSHYRYQFSVTADVHRQSLLVEILENYKGRLASPNHLEHYGIQYTQQYPNKTVNACFKQKGCVISQDLNRVQDVFQNPYGGTEAESADNLIKAYKKGKRIQWKRAWGVSPNDPFTGRKYFELI